MNPRMARLSTSGLAVGLLLVLATGGARAAGPSVPPGPPFPPPVDKQAVYDFAGILSEGTIADAEATIDAIEARTGAEVVVYTQGSGEYPTTEETEAKARALIDQWGIGRAGFDDGMVIFFDMDPSLEHGQVQLYAAPGFEAAYLTNQERQAIYENDMLPHLRDGDFDGALTAALGKVDAAATPQHAAELQTARRSTPSSGWSAPRSCSWDSRAGPSSRGAGSARTRSIWTTRRSSCRRRRRT